MLTYETNESGKYLVKDGDVVIGEYLTESAAQAKLHTLEKSTNDNQVMSIYAPLVKVDTEKREVYGYAAIEEPDESGEIMDYETSKPFFQKWSAGAHKRSGGKSLGNVREMHESAAAGKIIHIEFDDTRKAVYVGAKIADDAAWRKVLEGVYTGYSIGGKYMRKWLDAGLRKIRYTANPYEISIVDAPCVPGAVFEIVKADGLTESRAFAPGNAGDLVKLEAWQVEADVPVSEDAMPQNANGDEQVTVENMPEVEQPMQINPDNVPSGDELAARHVGVKELEATTEPEPVINQPEPEGVFKNKVNVKPRERRMVKVRQPRMVKVKQAV